MVKVHPAEVKLADLIAIGATPGMRTALAAWCNPAVPNRYVGRSAPWKGFRKAPGERFDEYIRRFSDFLKGVSDAAPNVASGLTACVDISKRFAGTKGVVLATMSDGYTCIMPAKAAAQSAGRPPEVGKTKVRTKYRVINVVGAPSARVLRVGIPAGGITVPTPR